ncbi:unnamed protein product [Soboliphyme baturini]|uniref:RNB domain-containing protein n=1 Tax=Soboliphyme baturini TaxID=241478 RepID=A0A183IPF9_9BILA|nr:unnamed protein product [Soboliphyme baturini]
MVCFPTTYPIQPTDPMFHFQKLSLRSNYLESYVEYSKEACDVLVYGMKDRNRAFNMDIVAVRLKDRKDWKVYWSATSHRSDCNRPAKYIPLSLEHMKNIHSSVPFQVVFIFEKVHSRICSGILKHYNETYALFSPIDSRIPRMLIDRTTDAFSEIVRTPEMYHSYLFAVMVKKWTEYHKLPLVELKNRRDFRNELVFTIDPSTAKDLDDALHVKVLDDKLIQVGVHIADVSYFVKAESALDAEACTRGNSVYFVNKVIPMLPPLLCEQLCSLNAGSERLTFSVVFAMNAETAEIVDTWFGRTIIKSHAQLSYEIAQQFIDEPEREWTADDVPLVDGSWTVRDIAVAVNTLNKLAIMLRKKRIANGALMLDERKLNFVVQEKLGEPVACNIGTSNDSNRLIEEFMLLANIAVAEHLYRAFPKTSVLRRHPVPKVRNYLDMVSRTIICLLKVSLLRKQALYRFISHSLLCHIDSAVYFCSGCESDFYHFALNVPFYTHFTSPIRRYPDIMVHRLLADSLGYHSTYHPTPIVIQNICSHCNTTNLNARVAYDRSVELFFWIFVKVNASLLSDDPCMIFSADKALALEFTSQDGAFSLSPNFPAHQQSFAKH